MKMAEIPESRASQIHRHINTGEPASQRTCGHHISSKMKILVALYICGLINVITCDVCNVNPNSVNLARFGRVCQSSAFRSMPYPGPERGVDGIAETNHTLFTCVITNLEEESWWSLDLEESYFIGTVRVVLRQDNCWNCLEKAVIRIGDSPDYKNPVCAVIEDISQSEPVKTYFCNGIQGRYVTIIHAGHAGIVSFCEVMVYQYIPPAQQEQSSLQKST